VLKCASILKHYDYCMTQYLHMNNANKFLPKPLMLLTAFQSDQGCFQVSPYPFIYVVSRSKI